MNISDGFGAKKKNRPRIFACGDTKQCWKTEQSRAEQRAEGIAAERVSSSRKLPACALGQIGVSPIDFRPVKVLNAKMRRRENTLNFNLSP